MLAAVARIAAAVDVPVTADMERGYGLEPAELAERLLETGAVGLNYEDTAHDGSGGVVDAEPQAERIAVLAGAGLIVNARIDVYARKLGEPQTRLEEALRRAALYRDAGATCLFPILLDDEAELMQFVALAGAPVNGLLHARGLSLAQLRAAGVARISVGSGLASAAVDHAAAIAAALLDGQRPAAARRARRPLDRGREQHRAADLPEQRRQAVHHTEVAGEVEPAVEHGAARVELAGGDPDQVGDREPRGESGAVGRRRAGPSPCRCGCRSSTR